MSGKERPPTGELPAHPRPFSWCRWGSLHTSQVPQPRSRASAPILSLTGLSPPLATPISGYACDKGAGSGTAGMAAAIPIKSKAANLFIISNKSRIKTSAFYARQLYRQVLLRARISYGISVRPSVRPSVTTRWYTKHR